MSKYSDKVKAREKEIEKGIGWHWIWCALCGRKTKTSHFGGNQELSWCQACYQSSIIPCLECFAKGQRIKNERVDSD